MFLLTLHLGRLPDGRQVAQGYIIRAFQAFLEKQRHIKLVSSQVSMFGKIDCFTFVPQVRNDVIARKYDEAISPVKSGLT